MKSIFAKYFVLAIILTSALSVSAQQKQRTSERSFQQEVQKANRLKEQRNKMVQNMENNQRLNRDQKPRTNPPLNSNPAVTPLPKQNLQGKHTLLN